MKLGNHKNGRPCRARGVPPFQARFWSKVTTGDGCWEWTGALTSHGYGNIALHGKSLKTHRVAYELAIGAIPEGLCVLHRCDNRKCVRPDHLFLGTKNDNTQDMLRKGRDVRPYGNRSHCRNGHEIALVGVVRVITKRGEYDYCRICRRDALARSSMRTAARRRAERAAKRQEVAA